MKNLQANLFIVLALGLCGLCTWQWYAQTIQRTEIQTLNRMVFDRDTAIQGYTNSIATLNHQVNQMDASLTEMKAVAATNEQLILSQKAEIEKPICSIEVVLSSVLLSQAVGQCSSARLNAAAV